MKNLKSKIFVFAIIIITSTLLSTCFDGIEFKDLATDYSNGDNSLITNQSDTNPSDTANNSTSDSNTSNITSGTDTTNTSISGLTSGNATTTTTEDITPPQNVNNFNTQANGNNVDVTWINPVETDFHHVKVCKATTNCDALTETCTGIYTGTNTTFTDTNSDGTYCYKIFTYDSTGNASSGVTSTVIVDTTTPTATVKPTSGFYIAKNDTIIITFSETMDTSTINFIINGLVDGTDYNKSWSTTTYGNDTLTITPTGQWTGTLTITVDCDDLEGNSLTTLNINYTVVNGIIYVYVNSSETTENGTMQYPYKTIQAGVDVGVSGDMVYVAVGTYNEAVTMKSGVSLYGGFNVGWSIRNTTTYETIISPLTVVDTVTFSTGLGSDTILDGFKIVSLQRGISIDGNSSAIIQNNNIDASNNGIFNAANGNSIVNSSTVKNNIINSSTASGIWNYATNSGRVNSLIQNNKITSSGIGIDNTGSSQAQNTATIEYNIMISASNHGLENAMTHTSICTPIIRNNVIKGGGSCGIYNSHFYDTTLSPTIQNNTIVGTSYGIKNEAGDWGGSCSPLIQNNIIFTTGSGSCIVNLRTPLPSPTVTYNNFFDCSSSYGGSNINENISDYLDSEYRFTGDLSSFTFDTLGTNLSASYTKDKDNNTRTVPFSMGAYEYD